MGEFLSNGCWVITSTFAYYMRGKNDAFCPMKVANCQVTIWMQFFVRSEVAEKLSESVVNSEQVTRLDYPL
jgi:hypothetical protein